MTKQETNDLAKAIEALVLDFERRTGFEVFNIHIGSRSYSDSGERIQLTFRPIPEEEAKGATA